MKYGYARTRTNGQTTARYSLPRSNAIAVPTSARTRAYQEPPASAQTLRVASRRSGQGMHSIAQEAEFLVSGWNLVDLIDDDNVKWDVFTLHEFEPELFLECRKNVRPIAANGVTTRRRAGRRAVRHCHIGT
jgi:hypothetical protein